MTDIDPGLVIPTASPGPEASSGAASVTTLDLTGEQLAIDVREHRYPAPIVVDEPIRRTDRRRLLIDGAVLALAVATGARWLWFRAAGLSQLGVAGWGFYAVEVATVLALVYTSLVVSGRRRPRPPTPPPPVDSNLDVFIPVAGEPIEIVRPAIEAALDLDHPATVYLCDDSIMAGADNGAEIAALAAELGVTCLTRRDGAPGKAGNLNHALTHSCGELILVIDADHQVDPDAGDRLLGWFRDSDVAFVTTPQRFFDGDDDPLNPNEPVFYHGMQAGRDGHDFAFSTGNGVAYRRHSLAEVGGFSEWNIVEDLHTSMNLHAAGWRSVFVPEPVTTGHSPDTTAEYARQRLRWATDSMRLLFFDNPLGRTGLSARGRIFYLHVVGLYVLLGIQVGLQLGPPLWQFFRVELLPPTESQAYLTHLVPWLAAVALTLVIWAGSASGAVRTLRTCQLLAPISIMAAVRALTGRRQGGATSKGRQRRVNGAFVAAITPLVLLAVTMALAVVDRRPHGSEVALFWACFLLILGLRPALRMGRRSRWATAAARSLSLLAIAITATAFGVAQLGWTPPAGTFASFEPDTVARGGAVHEANLFGDTFVRGPAVPAPGPAPPTTPAAGTPTPAAAPTPTDPALLVGGDGLYVGLTADDLPNDTYGFDRWLVAGAQPQLMHWYQQWGSGDTRFRTDWLEAADARGAVPMISWEAWAKPEVGYASAYQPLGRLAPIAAGEHDAYITEWAEAAASYGKPIVLRPFHEMNGTWYPWSVGINDNTAEDFVAAWRHIHDVFDDAGADNVAWVWSINTLAFYEQGQGVEEYYPGDDVVDWVAMSAFNWADSAEWSTWVDPAPLVAGTIDLLQGFDKPIMLAEVGTGTTSGDPVAWVSEAMAHFSEIEDLHAVVWFDHSYDTSVDFRLGDEQLAALVEAVRGDPSIATPLHFDR